LRLPLGREVVLRELEVGARNVRDLRPLCRWRRRRRRRGRGRRLLHRIADDVTEQRTDRPAAAATAGDAAAAFAVARGGLDVVDDRAGRDAADGGADDRAGDRAGSPLAVAHGAAAQRRHCYQTPDQTRQVTHAPPPWAATGWLGVTERGKLVNKRSDV